MATIIKLLRDYFLLIADRQKCKDRFRRLQSDQQHFITARPEYIRNDPESRAREILTELKDVFRERVRVDTELQSLQTLLEKHVAEEKDDMAKELLSILIYTNIELKSA